MAEPDRGAAPQPDPSADAIDAPEVIDVPDVIDASRAVDATVGGSRACPFLVAEGGGWRLDIPSRDHRCGAVSPPASLSPEKQARLCLTAGHVGCATYLASMDARGTRLGAPVADRATRWGLARTTTVIEDAGGLRSQVTSLLSDRRRWPAIPAVLLVVTLIVLAVSGFRGGGPATANATPTPALTSTPTTTTHPTTRPSAPAETAGPSATAPAPSARPSATPVASTGPTETFRIYKVKSGDTLSLIASKYGTTSRAIADLNGFKVTTTLHIGQVLKIPN